MHKGDKAAQQGNSTSEPPDAPDKPLMNVTRIQGRPCQAAKVVPTNSTDPLEIVPKTAIPAAGRGNSEDGDKWLNPSASQLFRALQRKNKPIELEDALPVAAVHEMVTDATWSGIMEFETMHEKACGQPTLSRFEGKDGIYSPKARFMNLFGVNLPFDRHDWYVDRCGKEVRYIIDYYAIGEENVEYFIDARPAGLSGLWDRLRLAAGKVKAGERPW